MTDIIRLFNKTSIISAFLFLLSFSSLQSQELIIQSVDSTSWPQLKVQLKYKGKNKFTKDLIKISKNNELVDFTISEGNTEKQKASNKAIYFLVEASGNTYGKSIADIRSAIRSYIEILDDDDIMNVGYFSSIEIDSMGLQNISEKFHNRREGLKYDLDSKIRQVKDSLLRVDLLRSVREGLDYVIAQKGLPEQKVFIVISTGKNNTSSPVTADVCIEIAKSAQIAIHTLLYSGVDSIASSVHLKKLSNATEGGFKRAFNDEELLNHLKYFVNLPPPNKLFEGIYDVLIDVSNIQENDKIRLDLHYNGTRQIIQAANPVKNSLLNKDYQLYLLISVGILVFIIIIMILAKVFSKKTTLYDNNEDKETKNEIESNLSALEKSIDSSAANTSNNNPALIKADAVAQKIALLVSIDGRTQTYPIKKTITIIGRHQNCDIIINEQTLTGKHARIEITSDGILLIDQGSTNGTYVNGKKIKTQKINNGDQIKMGNVEMNIRIA